MKVQDVPARDFFWFEARTGYHLPGDACAIGAFDSFNRIRGMVGYDHWTPNAAQIHIALDSPAALRALLPEMFRYPFELVGRSVLMGIIPAHNEKSWKLAEHIGMRETHRVRDGWAQGDDLIVYEMRRESCRWLSRRAA